MFDTARPRRVLLLVILLGISTLSVIAADIAALLGEPEEAAIDQALHCLKMTRDDLSYKKDYSDAPFRLAKVQRFLEQPLELPKHAEEVLGKLRNVQSLRALAEFVWFEIEEKPWGYEDWEDFPLPILANNDLQSLPAVLQPTLSNLVIGISLADWVLARAFSKTPRAEQQRAVARYAVANLWLETDRGEVDALGKLGFDSALMRDMIARDESLETGDEEYACDLLPLFDKMEKRELATLKGILMEAVDRAVQSFTSTDLRNAIPPDAMIRIDTRLGPVFIGGTRQTNYTEDALLIIDLGGDDLYECSAGAANGLANRPISIVIDLDGNDTYRSGTLSQGAGVFGIGILVDCGGDDIYEAKHLCQGTGLFGVGILADYGGNDSYSGDIDAQGAGMFGIGVLWDRAGDDRYFARQSSQGFGYTGGLGLVLDEKGNDTYYAGGKYSDHERLPEHFLACSQGFGYGMRPDASGGVGILCDLTGNDVYTTDIYGQGVSYFYSLGMLLDGQGHDLYRCHQYGQGAGIHLSAGILADWQGDDQYVGRGIVQGAAHDWSVGMLFDKQGNDQYIADSTAQGSALYNSTALLVDSAGNDVYASPKGSNTQAAGHDGSVREYGTIALLVDLGGKDAYSNGPRDDFIALKPLHGCALDLETTVTRDSRFVIRPTSRESPLTNHESRITNHVPPFASTPTELSKPRDDRERRWLKLIRQATQYPDTRERAKDKALAYEVLKRDGTAVLPFWLRQLDHDAVTVRVRLDELMEFVGGTNAASALIDALQSPNESVRRMACYYVGKLQAPVPAELVRSQLAPAKVRSVALWALGQLKDRSALADALRYLNDPQESVRMRAATCLGKLGDARAVPALIRALDDPLWDVRYAAQTALIKIGKPSLNPMLAGLAKGSDRARPYLIEALGRVGDARTANALRPYLRSDDSLSRGMAVQAIASLSPRWSIAERLLLTKSESDPFVRSRLTDARVPE